jgi:hypothetical protein
LTGKTIIDYMMQNGILCLFLSIALIAVLKKHRTFENDDRAVFFGELLT